MVLIDHTRNGAGSTVFPVMATTPDSPMGTTGMQFESPTLEFEAVLNLLLQSSLVVVISGTIFFLLGFWMAWLTWGRYRRQCLYLRQDMTLLEEEVIALKKKLANQMLAHPVSPPQRATPSVKPNHVVSWPTANDTNQRKDHDAEEFPEVATLKHEGVVKGTWHGSAKLT